MEEFSSGGGAAAAEVEEEEGEKDEGPAGGFEPRWEPDAVAAVDEVEAHDKWATTVADWEEDAV